MTSSSVVRASRPLLVLLALGSAAPASIAQLVTPKTLPVAQGDQFMIFPTQRFGMGGADKAAGGDGDIIRDFGDGLIGRADPLSGAEPGCSR